MSNKFKAELEAEEDNTTVSTQMTSRTSSNFSSRHPSTESFDQILSVASDDLELKRLQTWRVCDPENERLEEKQLKQGRQAQRRIDGRWW
jgi:hypothetical protein